MKTLIVTAQTEDQVRQVHGIFLAYATWLAEDFGISLEFQGIDEELATLPGKYAPPGGTLALATDGQGAALGCVALRPFSPGVCEVKRLYVLPAARGLGLGRRLATHVVEAARAMGYGRALLDTGPHMHAAQALYRDLGFREIEPYYHNPIPGCLFMELDLTAAPAH